LQSCTRYLRTRSINSQDPERKQLHFINRDVRVEYYMRLQDKEANPGSKGSEKYKKHENNINQSIIEVDVVGWLILVWDIAFTNKEGQDPLSMLTLLTYGKK